MVLGIYGAGGLGREVLDLAHTVNQTKEQWRHIAFISDAPSDALINNAEVINFTDFEARYAIGTASIAIAVGEPKSRAMLRDKVLGKGYRLQTLVHPTAFIGAQTQIGEGTIIQINTFTSCNVVIGQNTLLQPFSSVGHDCVIGNNACISTFTALSGNCVIGEQVYIGVGTSVKENTVIEAHSIIGMGSVVVRDIPQGVIALGNPARVMKKNESGYVFH